jgi:hypothetical protein
MHRCPKCGYRERFNWPTILRGLVFYGLCLALILGAPRKYRLIALGAMMLFSLVQLWESSRSGRNLDSKLVRLFGDGSDLSPKPPANG